MLSRARALGRSRDVRRLASHMVQVRADGEHLLASGGAHVLAYFGRQQAFQEVGEVPALAALQLTLELLQPLFQFANPFRVGHHLALQTRCVACRLPVLPRGPSGPAARAVAASFADTAPR